VSLTVARQEKKDPRNICDGPILTTVHHCSVAGRVFDYLVSGEKELLAG
jgi:hypothetical protein